MLTEVLKEGSPVTRVASGFRSAGHELYLVGGSVRDGLLGSSSSQDFDFATSAEPKETLRIVRPLASAVWEQGVRFGTVGAQIDSIHMEITTFRTEKYQPSSRHPEVTYAADIETDLSRRDFTVNAMAIRLPEREAIDPFDGVKDLKAKLLRTPLDPLTSFTDDPLRMLRAFRFASQLGFKIDKAALEAISQLKEELKTISSERIRDEFARLLVGKEPGRALRLADQTGLTDLFLPELSTLKLEQDPMHKHKDVFHHTLAVVERTDPVLELRLAALLHDVGKPRTRAFDDGKVTFHQHDVVGAKIARRRLRTLKFSNEVTDTVYELIRLHHRFHGYEGDWSDSAVRRYVRDAGHHLSLLNRLVRADCTTRNPARAKRLQGYMDQFEKRIEELKELEELERIRPGLDGNAIMAHLGIEPGPLVGEAWNFLLELRLDEGELPQEELLRRLDDWAASRGLGKDPA